MRMPMMRRFRAPLIAAIAAATLSGCIGLGGKTPPFLLTLDPEAEPQAGTARTAAEAATLTILLPPAPPTLPTTPLPVQQDAASVTSVTGDPWGAAPSTREEKEVGE